MSSTRGLAESGSGAGPTSSSPVENRKAAPIAAPCNMEQCDSFFGRIGCFQTRLRLPLLVFAASMLMLSAQRFALIVAQSRSFSASTGGVLFDAMLVGLRFDLVIACTLVAPMVPVLFTVPVSWLGRRRFQSLVAGYAAAALALLLLLLVVDFYFFEQFEERLNDKVLDYLTASHNEYLFHIIWNEYPFVWALIGAALAFAGAFMLMRHLGFNPRYHRGPLWHAVWPVASIPLVVLGIRGTLSSHAINSGIAYRGHAPAVSQLSLNAGFTMRQALITYYHKDSNPGDLFDLPSLAQSAHRAAELIVQPTDEVVGDPANPLHRITRTGRPQRPLNVVVILLESIHWPYFGAMGAKEDFTPYLSRLMDRSLAFDHCYCVGMRTERGISGLLASFPDLPGSSVTTRSRTIGGFLTIGNVLKERGYRSMFLNGGAPHRDHRASFLGSNGFDAVLGEDDLSHHSFRTDLGWSDEDVLQSANEWFTQQHASGTPFFATILTMSNHRPYALPPGSIEATRPVTDQSPAFDTVRYTDWAVGRFLDAARREPYFDDTLFVITADHMGGPLEYPHTPDSFRVPFFIYAPRVLGEEGRRIASVCSQMDIAPTILSLLGGEYEHCFFGSSVLDRAADRGFAFGMGASGLYFIDQRRRALVLPPNGGVVQLYDLPAQGGMTRPPAQTQPQWTDELRADALSLLGTAQSLYRSERYNLRRDDAPKDPPQ